MLAHHIAAFCHCGFLSESSIHRPITQPLLPASILASLLLMYSIILPTGLNSLSYAQVSPAPITTSGLNTQVSGPIAVGGKTQFNITGGTRPGGGANLFHSFGEFGVPANNIANFLNETPAVATSNILGRVTGGNISNIFGTIQTTGFGNANLFLMNPAGFLFGPNATVNVGGMVAFTSADYLKLADGVRFNAIMNPAADALLSASPVAAFGFLGSNPGAITVRGSQFTVTEGQGILLAGGNINITAGTLEDGTVQPARLSAPGGQINLGSVASPGELFVSNLEPAPTMILGSLVLSNGSLLKASADAAGTVKIRGGQLVIADATLSADTGNVNGAPVAIDINVTGDLLITDTRAMPAITAGTSGTGDAGAIQIAAANVEASTTSQEGFTLIDTHTLGDGRAGNVTVTTHTESATGNLLVSGTVTTDFRFIDSGTRGPGTGGDVTLNAKNIDLKQTTISTGDLVARQLRLKPSGSAGSITMAADRMDLLDSNVTTEAFAAFADSQQAGDITIHARDINMVNGQFGATGIARGGAMTIEADSFVTDFTFFQTATVSGPGGGISVKSRVVELTNGSALISSTLGDGNAGDILVTATDHVSLLGDLGTNPQAAFQPSGLFSNSFGDFGSQGTAGNVIVTTPRLEMVGGRINTVTQSSGRGGDVTLNIRDSVSISGEFLTDALVVPSIFDIGPLAPSGVVTSTIGSELCSGPCGDAGHISITTSAMTLENGGRIDSGTSSTGLGGNITISATNTMSLSGTLSDGTPVGIFSLSIGTEPGSGSGGNVAMSAGQSFTISNGASVSASSTGPGKTGNIQIDAGKQFAMTNSTVTTEADAASGGTIKITTTPSGMVQLTNSTISASAHDGTGGGGSVNIDPQFVILQNSHILARADQGPGGNISITTNLLLQDANSVISASSGNPALNGTVTIQSPNAPASGKIQPLGKTPLLATSLLNQHCAALAGGEFSSFTVAGRDSLPTEPGSWLTSPLFSAGVGEGLGVRGEGLEGDAPILSLRQIAPPGFLTQAFALDWSAGCTS